MLTFIAYIYDMSNVNQAQKAVAIFDDDEDILAICSYVLEESGWTVHTFVDCSNIVERVREINPQAILMDNWIPEEGGIAATQLLKQTPDLSNIPVIYFSANSDIEKLSQKAGADGYLAKPFDLDDLIAIIDQQTCSAAE